MSLGQGCVCCSLRNDIGKALLELHTRAKKRGCENHSHSNVMMVDSWVA